MGAEGINMGARFTMKQEAPLHPNLEEWLLRTTERDTMLLLRAFRITERVVRSPTSEKALAMEKKRATIDEFQSVISGNQELSVLEDGRIDEGMRIDARKVVTFKCSHRLGQEMKGE
jgi:NAD(P)H-dependent flavin oxidoreductase YrpB (nitropropane dioxygenase family)